MEFRNHQPLPATTEANFLTSICDYTAVINDFRNAMLNAGIAYNGEIIGDGEIQRFFVPGDEAGTENGFYKLYLDNLPAGFFGHWGKVDVQKWCSTNKKDLTPQERILLEKRIAENQAKHEEEKIARHAAAKLKANELWAQAGAAQDDHPYLLKKAIKPFGIRQIKDSLLIPLLNNQGELQSLQFIASDEKKRFLGGGETKGNFFSFGEITDIIYICEGYATGCSIHQAIGKHVVVAFNAGNLLPVAKAVQSNFSNKKIIIAADNDQFTEGNPGVTKANEAAQAIGAVVITPDFSACSLESKATDFNDLFQLAGLEEVKRQFTAQLPLSKNKLKVIDLKNLLALDIPPRELILSPWLPKAGLCMIHARPGVGKTHLSLGIGYAVAAGVSFLKWQASKPRGVLLLDGEMPLGALQERLARIVQMHPVDQLPAPLHFITPDLQELGMPDLGTIEGQQQINQYITDDIELVIVDNLSCLVRTGKENDSESWQPVQSWALSLRAKGKSVLFIHHQGKKGSQRGSSKKEDVLDTVISLKRPDDYSQDQGACFIVSFEKARGFHGDDAKPFEALLTIDNNNNPCWVIKDLEDSTFEKVVTMINDGISQKEIAGELGINKSNVSRHVAKAKEAGLINFVRGKSHVC